jgi:hypothetical protein
MRLRRKHLSAAGLAAGAAAWGVSTQAAYTLVHFACTTRFALTAPLTLFCTAIALFGAWLSYRAAREPVATAWEDARGGRAYRFTAWVGAGAGILFALAIANQAAASLIVGGCLR